MEQKNDVEEFLDFFKKATNAGTFVKMTISKPAERSSEWTNIYLRPVEVQGSASVLSVLRYKTKDQTEHRSPQATTDWLRELLGTTFLQAHLFTQTEDVTLQFSKKRRTHLVITKPTHTAAPDRNHNRQKTTLLDPHKSTWLRNLGITGAEGNILKNGQKKFRQINKYLEIITAIFNKSELPTDLHIVDFGSGKGYLTFALYDYLTNYLNLKPTITGVELRSELVDLCNDLAREQQFEQLQFICDDIQNFDPERLEVLIALHACDVATDFAIAKGIQAKAEVVICVPCCHKQLRKRMTNDGELSALTKHGILAERQAELLTDAIRALYLEKSGYATRVFEFISTEHTPKNVMIVGQRGGGNTQAQVEIDAIKEQFGVEYHFLERLL